MISMKRRTLIKSLAACGMIAGTSIAQAVEPPKSWDVETDVVVVGAGGAGLTAAVIAGKTCKVIVLEKAPSPEATRSSPAAVSMRRTPKQSRNLARKTAPSGMQSRRSLPATTAPIRNSSKLWPTAHLSL